MINNELRIGNFTSSEIVALTKNGKGKDTFGKPYYTYIDEKNMERRLGRSLTTEVTARPLAWGKMVESYVFSILGLDYKPCSKSTIRHPKIDFWAGSPDAEKYEKENIAVDIKCPLTLKSFCTMIDSFESGGMDLLRKEHKEGEKYYWQIVSNAILMGAKKGELLVYCPYTEELEEIRELANNYDGEHAHQFFFITVSGDDELPNLKKGGHYKNINKLTFDIPQQDIDFLTDRVKEAGKSLIKINK